jgi:hypothetical protein
MKSKDNASHSLAHNKDAFCGNAGPEELKHLEELVSALSDKEVIALVKKCGFPKLIGEWEELCDARNVSENVIDEIAREDFYREYRIIVEARNSS